jgi:hypothetical protein
MGFNTVAFVLNDLSDQLVKSPKTVCHMLSHPPLSLSEESYYDKMYAEIAHSVGETSIGQALRVMPSFHSKDPEYYLAGGNCISNLKVMKFHTYKGRKCVMLELPEHMQEKK